MIHGLLRAGETMNIIAPSKTGKSWLVNNLAICVAAGRDWLERYATERGRVLIIDNELHGETSANRIPKVAKTMGIPLGDFADTLDVWNLRGGLTDLFTLTPVLEAIEAGRYRVIVLDAWYRFMPEGKRQLPRMREDLQREAYCRLLPGYVRQYIQSAAPLVGVEIEGDPDKCFTFTAATRGAVDPLLHTLEEYPPRQRGCLSVIRPSAEQESERIWVHPSEPPFKRFRAMVSDRLGKKALQGAVFIDPTTERPYIFHLALVSVLRQADEDLPDLRTEETLDCQLVGVKQFEGAEVALCPVEHLLLLRGGQGLPTAAQRLALNAGTLKEQAGAFILERVARQMALQRRERLLAALGERERFVHRGFDYREAELATARASQAEKARAGNSAAIHALQEIKEQQRSLTQRRAMAIASIRREPELIAPGNLRFLAHALVVPSESKDDRDRHDAEVEKVAMEIARAFEEASGATVADVHTPPLARAAGLSDNPGFDLLATYPDGSRRAIEVKGRGSTGDVEVTATEWAAACNHRDGYWLYAVYDCATPAPRLMRVQDPFGALLAKAKGSMLISSREIIIALELSQ